MSSKLIRSGLPALLAASLLVVGCGLEGLFNTYTGEYPQPVSRIRGTLAMTDPKISVYDPADNAIKPFEMRVDGGAYEVDLYSGSYAGLRIQATQGQAIVESFVPALDPEGTADGVDLNTESTAKVKFVQGLLGPSGKEMTELSDDLLCIMGKKIQYQFDQPASPAADVLAMMTRVLGKADPAVSTTDYVFQKPTVTVDADGGYAIAPSHSVLNSNWVARTKFDYDNDGFMNLDTAPFDAKFLEAIQPNDAGTELTLSAPPDPTMVRVVFAVDFRDGQKDGNCNVIKKWNWVRDQPGKQMFFTGGIHTTSPVQDPLINAKLGAWSPNQIKMYDDGTHGDKVAGDGIWSITFDLPRGLRIGYKYTWGHLGDQWGGTEEWPGNQRILEIDDVNGDGYVYRKDNFGDEATNKDLANANLNAKGSLEWGEILIGAYPETGEVPVDTDNDCVRNGWVTPDWVPALTVPCSEFVAP